MISTLFKNHYMFMLCQTLSPSTFSSWSPLSLFHSPFFLLLEFSSLFLLFLPLPVLSVFGFFLLTKLQNLRKIANLFFHTLFCFLSPLPLPFFDPTFSCFVFPCLSPSIIIVKTRTALLNINVKCYVTDFAFLDTLLF